MDVMNDWGMARLGWLDLNGFGVFDESDPPLYHTTATEAHLKRAYSIPGWGEGPMGP
jgi:hypothetical protein